VKISNHAKMRMRERTEMNHQERRKLFRHALLYGKSPGNLEEGIIRDFLETKENKGGCKVKLYKGYLFLYSKNSHQLYTMYKCPEGVLKKEGGSNERKILINELLKKEGE